MDKITELISAVKHKRGNFAVNSEKELLNNIDNALQLVYKEGFSGASVIKEAIDTVPGGKKPKKKAPSSDKWLLPSLVLDNMEAEQIWQQLELWNKKALPLSIQLSSWALAKDFKDESDESDEEFDDEDAEDDDELEDGHMIGDEVASFSSEDNADDFEDEEDDLPDKNKRKNKRKDVFNDEDEEDEDEGEDDEEPGAAEEEMEVEQPGPGAKAKDKFFDFSEMEKFAEEPIADEADEMIYSEYVAEENIAADNKAMYSDFFDPPAKKSKVSEDAQRKDPANLSTYENKQAMQKRNAEQLEEENLAPKPWILSGEVDAKQRPQNSLLEQHVEFDHATRLAPIVTEEFSKSIEDIIRQRVIDKAWDDVERKVKPIGDVSEFRRRAMLDSEKPKMSLAELYEKDYLDKQKDQLPLGRDMPVDEKVEAIKQEMRDLFFKLDSLSHFQFTPKPPAPELRIVKNMPSATLEEAAPVTVNDANLLAPAEVKRPISGELKSKEEQTETDRKRARRRAKAHMRAKQKTNMDKLVTKAAAGDTKASKLLALEKLKTGSRVKIANEVPKKAKKGSKDGSKGKGKEPVVSGVKSSAEFFARLQDEVDTQVHQRGDKKHKLRRDAQ